MVEAAQEKASKKAEALFQRIDDLEAAGSSRSRPLRFIVRERLGCRAPPSALGGCEVLSFVFERLTAWIEIILATSQNEPVRGYSRPTAKSQFAQDCVVGLGGLEPPTKLLSTLTLSIDPLRFDRFDVYWLVPA